MGKSKSQNHESPYRRAKGKKIWALECSLAYMGYFNASRASGDHSVHMCFSFQKNQITFADVHVGLYGLAKYPCYARTGEQLHVLSAVAYTNQKILTMKILDHCFL